MRPPRRCPGCSQLVVGRCLTCSRQTSRRRGTRQEQGYDKHWLKLASWHLQQQPYCVFCDQVGILTTEYLQVDHVIPFTSIEDPRRLDPANLRTLCATCHARHTRQSQRPGVSHHGEPSAAKRCAGSLLRGQDG